MRALDRKALRDLWEMRGQALAIALVISSGVATLIMCLSNLESLESTRERFYLETRFADVFAGLKRAPDALGQRIGEIPGVDLVETRVVANANVDLDDFQDPITGRVVSIPDAGQPLLNRLYIQKGAFPEPGRDRQILISEAFAEAQGLEPGDELSAIIRGRERRLQISGIALSPEYIYQIRPGALVPDFERYAIIWMPRTPLGNAFDMDGAFNDVVLRVSRGASEDDVIDRLDEILEPYGGLGAHARDEQMSHHFLSEEFKQLEGLATMFPLIFLSVAAFLINVVIGRVISTQREQIAALKAFGYSGLAVATHYAKVVVVIGVVGAGGGVAFGIWLGKSMGQLYAEFYRFPYLDYVFGPRLATLSIGVSVVSVLVGAMRSVLVAMRLPPAEAMRPETPAEYRVSVVERLGLRRVLSQPARMMIRNIERRPVKSGLTIVGIAFACSVLMLGSFQEDAIDWLVRVQFGKAQREDLSVTFIEPTTRSAVHELESLEGVDYAETFRTVAVRLRFEHRDHLTSIEGLEPSGDLHRVLDTDLRPISVPAAGVLLTTRLAENLGVRTGETVRVEVLEGRRPTLDLEVAGLIQQYLGLGAYMHIDALNRALGDGDSISGAHLAVDSARETEIWQALDDRPRVRSVGVRSHSVASFYETMAETMLVFTFINTLLAGTIAVGVVYNSARVILSERSRELASLRVLGLTRGEISYILLGELALLTLAAIPLGFVFGRGFCALLVERVENDLYRIPLILEPSTYAFAATVVLIAALLSGLVVRRKLDALDLIAVLKTRE